MEWLKELLKNAGVEDIEGLEQTISKELPKHFKPAKDFNDLKEKLENEQETVRTITKEKEDLEKSSISLTEHTQKMKDTVIDNSIKMLAQKYEAVNIDDVTNLFLSKNKDSLKVSDDFKVIEGIDEQFSNYVKDNPFYFGKNVVKGQEPDNKGKSPKETTLQDEYAHKHKEALESHNTALAIQIKQEAYEKGINL